MRQQVILRTRVLAGALTLVAFTIILRMLMIQNSQEAAIFQQMSSRYANELQTFYPDRGEIYDREGHLLAGNKTVYEIGVDLNMVKDPNAIAMAVSAELGSDYEKTLQMIQELKACSVNKTCESTDYSKSLQPNQIPAEGLSFNYIVLDDYVEAEHASRLQQLKIAMQNKESDGTLGSLTGLEFKPHPHRSYPEGALASNILGFVGRENRGYFGVEEKYDTLLAGSPVQVMVPTDPNKAFEIPHIPEGTSLVLTVNRDLQDAAERILDQAISKYGAQGGTITVMDPRNGEILAMAVTPRMDLNQFWNYGVIYKNASEFNPAISMPYEPGSVLKILTMAAALQNGTVAPGTPFLDTGEILVGGAMIKNWDGKAWGQQDMTGCLQHSLNVCLAWVSTQMGAQAFYGFMDNFGLGHLTGIDLAGEAAGRLKLPGDGDWYPVDLGTNAFGQGVAVTPIQMLMAASSIANQGRTVLPHVLYAMLREGRQYRVPPQVAGSSITAATAHTLSDMLTVSLKNETSLALLPGYSIAGKTGTAQVPSPDGYYDYSATNASFIGWGPVDDPQFMIYVWLEKPSASIWGSETAAPVFAQMAEKVVVLMDIPPDMVRQNMVTK
jgi:cell division protein FtsI/penicillin-binding protein 2